VAAFLDVDLPDPHRGRPAGNWWRRFVTRLRSGALWRELAHHLVLLPQGILFFCVVVAAWSVALTALTLPATIWAIPDQQVYVWSGVALHGWVAGVLGALTGLVLLPLVPFVVRGLVEAEVALARLLLGPSRSEALEGRVSQLTETRSRVVDAAEAERRRIERDLHDGAQQRLVALAMDLGRAQEKFDTDPEGARALVDDAHREAKQALVELRDLARGIHPAVLTDRGLDAALSAVAGRSPVPVRLSIDVGERPDPTIEGIAYFVVCEALANVAKHAGARRASVTVARRGTQLLVEVTDDGHGGADETTGSGLVGLRDRVEGVDGWLHLSSPLGGPTTLLVELPCAS
jgi:signal transduction histidine kinase